jgi:uncharacterized protein (DUF1501 family)
MAALLDDLHARGMIDDTFVVAVGEMGRTPRVNAHAGRDHWTRAWSGVVAGGGVEPERCIGATDARAASVVDRPIALGELTATIYDRLGIGPQTPFETTTAGADLPLVDHSPIVELF